MPVRATRQPAKAFESWSFSRFSAYMKCPLAAKLEHLDKITGPKGPALSRGSNIHDLAASHIKGELKRLPDALGNFADLFEELRAGYRAGTVLVEDEMAFRKDWEVTQWRNWDECWLRSKVDVARLDGSRIDVIDWKTGKFRLQEVTLYEWQLELYALGTLILYSDAIPGLEVSPVLAYLDHGIVYPENPRAWTAKDIPDLKQQWEFRVHGMFADRAFAPLPNWSCQWCHYRAANKANGGGQCEF